jgi:hypothetical protein
MTDAIPVAPSIIHPPQTSRPHRALRIVDPETGKALSIERPVVPPLITLDQKWRTEGERMPKHMRWGEAGEVFIIEIGTDAVLFGTDE